MECKIRWRGFQTIVHFKNGVTKCFKRLRKIHQSEPEPGEWTIIRSTKGVHKLGWFVGKHPTIKYCYHIALASARSIYFGKSTIVARYDHDCERFLCNPYKHKLIHIARHSVLTPNKASRRDKKQMLTRYKTRTGAITDAIVRAFIRRFPKEISRRIFLQVGVRSNANWFY